MLYKKALSILPFNAHSDIADFTRMKSAIDFSNNPMGARLAEGVYVAVQIPETLRLVWDWRDWIYDASTGQIINDYHRD